MRILLIGASGFMGRHLRAAIHRAFGDDATLLPTGRQGAAESGITDLDLHDEAAVRHILGDFRPTHVINLAGIAAPAAAGRDPDAAWRLHLDAARQLGEAVLDLAPQAQLINTGTGLAYGASFRSGAALDEEAPLRPIDDYAASKAAGDLALGVLARRGLRVVLMRPFNQAGPGQSEDFVVPAFAAQVARIEAGAEPVMHVGNLDAERDFVDVRDVADAYVAAIARADGLEPGVILNLASGKPRRIRDILDQILALAAIPIRVEQDPARRRASDTPRALGSGARAEAILGWTPVTPFAATLRDVLDDQRGRCSPAR